MDNATLNRSHSVAIARTAARLHLGFLNPGDDGRRFGSLGLALDGPGLTLSLQRSDAIEVSGSETARAEHYLETICQRLGLKPRYRLTVQSEIPAHSGLGSGTQLALAVTAALRALEGIPGDISADAMALARGARSGIGISLFARGGFVLDGGRGGEGDAPPLLARLAFPEEWRVLLVRDRRLRGLSGEAERKAFRDLPRFPQASSAELCRLALLQVLPGLAEHDLAAFGAGITAMQEILGDHFAPAQGGRFSSTRVQAALAILAGRGATGIGQSSWGPAGFAFAHRGEIPGIFDGALPEGVDIQVRRGINQGAAIDIIPSDMMA
jgi:beta-RFAP synthase